MNSTIEFRIADTFSDSLAKLRGEEQKAAKTAAFDLQLNPANPGLKLHRLDRAKDKRFWSARVSRDLRMIVHRTDESLLLCYVDHHDKAYQWAERRKLEVHPTTGAAQLVEIVETVREVTVASYQPKAEALSEKLPLFAQVADQTLLGYGVPPQWLDKVKSVDEDGLLQIADHLPSEAAEALLELATGGTPQPKVAPTGVGPFEHPDAQRRFRVVSDVDELSRALEYPWEKWIVFLHPVQRQLVEKDYKGPARVTGSAGTGKTIVALHRAVFLARQDPDARVLLTTFSDTLASALRNKLRLLIGNEPRLAERIEVFAIDEVGRRLYGKQGGTRKEVDRTVLQELLEEAGRAIEGHEFSTNFLLSEWDDVVDAWQLENWESYRDVRRLGRKTRLPESKRKILWSIFEQVRERLDEQGLITLSGMFNALAGTLKRRARQPYAFTVVDEAQDISVPQLRFLAAMSGGAPNRLFFAGDLGQRIFQTPFSWKSLGVDVRGRSHTLRINYRTSHQIRRQADRLLDPEIADVDGIAEDRRGTVSVFNGPAPDIATYDSEEEENAAVAEWLKGLREMGVDAGEIAIFVRSPAQQPRAQSAVSGSGLSCQVLGERMETARSQVSVATIHLAKGLEFRAVAVMACDDEVIPLQERIESVADQADLEEVYETERHLLYVACTRARDHLFVSGVEPASEFLEDLLG